MDKECISRRRRHETGRTPDRKASGRAASECRVASSQPCRTAAVFAALDAARTSCRSSAPRCACARPRRGLRRGARAVHYLDAAPFVQQPRGGPPRLASAQPAHEGGGHVLRRRLAAEVAGADVVGVQRLVDRACARAAPSSCAPT